jgi:hypothetical protein
MVCTNWLCFSLKNRVSAIPQMPSSLHTHTHTHTHMEMGHETLIQLGGCCEGALLCGCLWRVAPLGRQREADRLVLVHHLYASGVYVCVRVCCVVLVERAARCLTEVGPQSGSLWAARCTRTASHRANTRSRPAGSPAVGSKGSGGGERDQQATEQHSDTYRPASTGERDGTSNVASHFFFSPEGTYQTGLSEGQQVCVGQAAPSAPGTWSKTWRTVRSLACSSLRFRLNRPINSA